MIKATPTHPRCWRSIPSYYNYCSIQGCRPFLQPTVQKYGSVLSSTTRWSIVQKHGAFLSTTKRNFVDDTQQQQEHQRPIALVMGVASQRSIAWACVESFLRSNYDCIVTYHIPSNSNNDGSNPSDNDIEKYRSKIEKLVAPYMVESHEPTTITESPHILCSNQIPKVLIHHNQRKLDAIIHSVAYAPEIDRPLLQTSASAFRTAQHISAYSLIEIIRECINNHLLSTTRTRTTAVTTLSYLGSVRAVPGYGNMGAAKASLESIVRTLASEVGSLPNPIRVNAISAGPIKTISSRGIPNFASIQHHIAEHAPLQRNVTVEEVAETVKWISSTYASGVTGQTIYVDAGYSSIVPITSTH
jgi:enoyl-[acyl-carrier protein] reductase I